MITHAFLLLCNVGSTVVESNYAVVVEMKDWERWDSGDFCFGGLASC
jgi:hypothetical protein